MACNSSRYKRLCCGNANDVIYGIIGIIVRKKFKSGSFFVFLLLAFLLLGYCAIN